MVHKRNEPGGARRGSISSIRRLLVSERGSSLPLIAATLLPLMAMIGSGVDMSRAYMAKTRLQGACDAAALAGRRVLPNDTLTNAADDPVRVEVNKFMNFNFPQGVYGTATFTPGVTKPTSGTIKVNAATTIPTSVMKIFGFGSLPISVSCEASQNFVNTDVVLILDVTGSMDDDIKATSRPGDNTRVKKIAALRDAVLALYDELKPIQDKLTAANLRLRYGIVPYSSGVNVGRILLDDSADNILGGHSGDTAAYQSRSNTASKITMTGQNRRDRCEAMPDATYNSGNSECTYYPAQQRTFDLSAYVATLADDDPLTLDPSPISIESMIGGSSRTASWEGCIEERATVNTITSSSGYAIPTGAFDLDMDLVPSRTDSRSRWRPYFPQVIFRQDDHKFINQVACPAPAKRLQTWARDDLEDYVGELRPTGGTYHDNGIIWGGRLISSAGVFGDSADTYNGMPVAKHIIFMTDGRLDTGFDGLYTTYGVERWDQRVGGSDESAQQARHRQRFKMVCNAIKSMNVSIWVVGFAVPNGSDADLKECASSASQVSDSTNKAALISKFAEIGKNIGALRLTQ